MTQEQANKAVQALLESRKEIFQSGIMRLVYPKECEVSVIDNIGTFTFDMIEDMSNPIGTVHGGMLVTLFDSCGGFLARVLTGVSSITTTDIQTSFLRPVQIGDEVTIQVKMTARGKTILHMTAELFLPDGTIGATASMTYYQFKKPLDQRQR